MKRLSRGEWIAVGVALAIILYFLMGNLIAGLFTSPDQTNSEQMNDNETTSSQPGPTAVKGSLVTVHYVGRLENGDIFDSSRERGQPFSFVIGQGMVIRGWDVGLLGARAGDKKTLTIAPADGYGAVQGHMLQNKTLIFDIEVLDVQNP